MEFLTKFPVMDRTTLMEMRKGIDFAFRDFSRAYGDGIEAFFDPLLYFLVWLEKLLINSPWVVIIGIICGLTWLASKNWKHCLFYSVRSCHKYSYRNTNSYTHNCTHCYNCYSCHAILPHTKVSNQHKSKHTSNYKLPTS